MTCAVFLLYNTAMAALRIGTCSWEYGSWVGLAYTTKDKAAYLREYAEHYDTVEVDQWFWSLFGRDRDLDSLRDMLHDLRNRKVTTYLNVNNHYGGSAPLTIGRIRTRL